MLGSNHQYHEPNNSLLYEVLHLRCFVTAKENRKIQREREVQNCDTEAL
jgi:hypothetical protein